MSECCPELILLTTLGCHLCDSAKLELWQAQERAVFTFSERDIALSDDDVALYGVRIPVLRYELCGAELDWPFNAADVVALIEQISK